MHFSSVVIFGGAGYIGSYFAAYLLDEGQADSIILADITRIKEKIWPASVRQAEKDGRVKYVEIDVRHPVDPALLPEKCDLIANFAAIHREPGHEDYEYYETNLAGAENVCDYAAAIGCNRIIFTSSIAPYGISPEPRTEKSLTVPVTAYGGSKLAAEKIHQIWQAGNAQNRILSIVRPGVVFGPSEGGNVPRMIKALRKGYFFYTGNKDTIKAGGYIKELPRAMIYVLERQERLGEKTALYNFSLEKPPSFGEYVDQIRSVAGISRNVPNVPFPLILTAGYIIDILARPLGIKHPFSPVRIRKLVRPNHIIPDYLIQSGYPYSYDLHAAFEDWKADAPEEWGEKWPHENRIGRDRDIMVADQKKPRIAVVHEWFASYAGSERVVEQILKIYPDADLYALVDFLPDDKRGFIGGRKAKTTFVQHLPLARTHFRHYLPLFPTAVERRDLRSYDLVISSSHCVAKGVRPKAGQVHVCYCHSPVRYAWDMQEEYLSTTGKGEGLKGKLIRYFLGRLRQWDLKTAPWVTSYVANSNFIASRISRFYGRESTVIHPPVATQDFEECMEKEDFYLAASRMVPYKKLPVIAEAFARMPELKLVIIGTGTESPKVEEIANKAPNIDYIGYQPFSVLKEKMQKARAFVFAAQEDFGIMPVEALACGTPVIAFGKGGALDSITPETGVFFDEQTPESIIKAVEEFEKRKNEIRSAACRKQAEKFTEELFRTRLQNHIETVLNSAHGNERT